MPLNLDPEEIMQKAIEVATTKVESSPKVAEILLRQALVVDPENQRALSLMGLTLYRLGCIKDALDHFERSLVVNPEDAEVFNNMALCYASMGDYEKSTDCLERALAIKPDQYLFLNNLALQYKEVGKELLAESCFKRALEIFPSTMVWCNLGGLYVDMREWYKGEACYLKALELEPNLAAPHVFISYVYGFWGNLERAFTEYEWRFDHFDQLKYYKRTYDQEKRWNGESLDGQTIILYGEQGWGDQIQYVRYVEQLKTKGAKTIVHCSKPLQRLMSGLPWVDEAICLDHITMTPDMLPEHDFHCSLLSLPFLLKDFKPSGKSYIKPTSPLNIKGIEDYKDKLTVGISWAGSPSHPNDQYRSMPLKEFEPLQLDGLRLFNLQVGSSKRFYPGSNRTIDFALGGNTIRLIDMKPMMIDYEQSANVISGLDLIISVDTSIVHLAGALGIPCWVLLPYNSDWRWGIGSEKTYWYDSLRLFRQQQPRDWSGVIQQVKGELERVLECQDLLQDKRSELQKA